MAGSSLMVMWLCGYVARIFTFLLVASYPISRNAKKFADSRYWLVSAASIVIERWVFDR
jgi:hypothetical protein